MFRHLDIGCSSLTEDEKVRKTSYSVWDILENLPKLVSLDVSCTEIGNKLYIDGKLKDL